MEPTTPTQDSFSIGQQQRPSRFNNLKTCFYKIMTNLFTRTNNPSQLNTNPITTVPYLKKVTVHIENDLRKNLIDASETGNPLAMSIDNFTAIPAKKELESLIVYDKNQKILQKSISKQSEIQEDTTEIQEDTTLTENADNFIDEAPSTEEKDLGTFTPSILQLLSSIQITKNQPIGKKEEEEEEEVIPTGPTLQDFQGRKHLFFVSELLENYIKREEEEKESDQTDKTLSKKWIDQACEEFTKVNKNSRSFLFFDNGYFDWKSINGYNRYSNVIPLKNNIVRPTKEWYKSNIKESELTKFYVDGSEVDINGSKFFVTAAPTPSNLKNFCLMIKKNNIGLWVCLTKTVEEGYRKADGFWEEEQPIYFASELVQTLNFQEHEEKQTGLIFKNVEITTKDGQSKAEFIQDLEWPDLGVPSTKAALEAVRKIIDKAIQIKSEGKNIVLHCSGGIGRACTLTAAISIVEPLKATLDKDANPREALTNRKIDVGNTVFQLRRQRHVEAVMSDEQYQFIHIAIAYWLEAYLKTREECPQK
jgi:protein tyrosine phosphatase